MISSAKAVSNSSVKQALSLVRVAVPTPLYKTFDYLLPEALNNKVAVGMRVLVSFGRRQCVAIIVDFAHETNLSIKQLKPIQAVLDDAPIFTESMLSLLTWAASYYQYPLGEVLQQALPTALRKVDSELIAGECYYQVTKLGEQALSEQLLKRARKQQALLALLQAHPQGLTFAEINNSSQFSKDLLNKLIEKNYIVSLERKLSEFKLKEDSIHTSPYALTDEQQLAYEQIKKNLGVFQVFLLVGVTGSGKTEIYLRAIADALQQGSQVLVLVPEIGLTPQTVKRFAERFALPIAVLHSNLTDKARLTAWQEAKAGHARIVIGTRSAIFTEFAKLGLIIIDEEHDNSFKQQEGFRYSARDLAVLRAKKQACPIVLGSATPSLESYFNAKRERYQLLTLKQRAGGASLPEFKLIDLCAKELKHGLAPTSIDKIKEHLTAGGQVLLFLNRRGYAPTMICHACAWHALCKHCDARLTLHFDPPFLQCHHCGYKTKLPVHCPDCASQSLRPLGVGTERLEKGLQQLFPDEKIVRIDRDSTQRKGQLQQHLDDILQERASLLIGTQMLAKGHHFPGVTLVIILNADSGLMSADYRASENFGQLLLQVAGRAGRADKAGEVLIQTHYPQHAFLQRLLDRDYFACLENLLTERQQVGLPPWCFEALIRAEAKERHLAESFLKQLRLLATDMQGVNFLGPVPAPMARRKGHHRAQLLLQANSRTALGAILNQLAQHAGGLSSAKKLHWSIDVDPLELY